MVEAKVASDNKRSGGLARLAEIIDSHPDWWRFPVEEPVRGFLGTGPIFFVGDQPSTSPWLPHHPNRVAFYGLLARAGLGNAHLTDLYKRRGKSGALRAGIPGDFQEHLEFFRMELQLLEPHRVIAIGKHAHDLLTEHVPEVRPTLSWNWHFAWVMRYNRLKGYEANLNLALAGVGTDHRPDAKPTYSVGIVVDPAYGEQLGRFASKIHVWAVDTPPNRAAAFQMRSGSEEGRLECGVTLFRAADPEDREGNLIGELGNVELHHGEQSHKPPVAVLEVVGIPINSSIRKAFVRFGYSSFDQTEEGFRATRRIMT